MNVFSAVTVGLFTSWSWKTKLNSSGTSGESFMAACHLRMTSSVFPSSQQFFRGPAKKNLQKGSIVPRDFLWCCIVWSGNKQIKVGLLIGNLFLLPVFSRFHTCSSRKSFYFQTVADENHFFRKAQVVKSKSVRKEFCRFYFCFWRLSVM